MKKIFLLFWFCLFPFIGEAEEGKCKNPIFLSAFEIDPNILILLDNSSSMNVIMQPTIESGYTSTTGFDEDEYIYSPNKKYDGPFKFEFLCQEDGFYTLGERTPNNWVCVYLVKNDYTSEDAKYWQGLYEANYLNWLLKKAHLGLWKMEGGANFYMVTLKRVNSSKTPHPPSFLKDLTDENGTSLLKEPKIPDKPGYYWFDEPTWTWDDWYEYWYKKPASRMNIAKYIVNDLIRTDWRKLFNLDVKLRYGLMVFRKYLDKDVVLQQADEGRCEPIRTGDDPTQNRGGDLLVECGSISTNPLEISHIKRIEDVLRRVISDRYTPLAESVYEGAMYFIGSQTKFYVTRLEGGNVTRKLIDGPIKYGTENMGIQSWCQDSSILLITDGFPTHDTEVPPLKGSGINDSDFDFDGDKKEPPKFHELVKCEVWNDEGIECNKLAEETLPGEAWTRGFCSHYLDDVTKYIGGSKTDLIAGTGTRAGVMGDERQYINTYIVGFQYDSPFLRLSAEADKCLEYDEWGNCKDNTYNPKNYFNLTQAQKRYFSATNPTKLKEYLIQIIEDIIKRVSSSVAVAVSISTSESRSTDYVVRARFDPRGWRGYLESFSLPYYMTATAVWEGGARLGIETKTFDDDNSLRNLDGVGKDRNIYTLNDASKKIEFKKDNSWILSRLDEVTWRGTSTLTPPEKNALISWIRGEYWDEEIGYLPSKYPKILDERPEGWRLFDIVYSTPLVLGAPNAWYGTETSGTESEIYEAFHNTYKYRQRMAFVGSNIGMLHAFNLDDTCAERDAWTGSCTQYEEKDCGKKDTNKPWLCGGWERWAYIPSNLLPYLRYKAEPFFCHFSGVDLGLVKTDILTDFGDGREWGTVLVGGEREGGSYYFALNITDANIMTLPSNASTKTVFWEYSNKEKLGDAMAMPEIGIVRKNKSGEDIEPSWVAFLTTASTNSTSGVPYIIPLNIATGKVFDWNPSGSDEIVVKDENKGITASIPLTSASVMDDFISDKIDFDDLIDAVYFGDSKGRVWKMTIGGSGINPGNDWKPYVIFEAKDPDGHPQPIVVPIGIAFTKDYKTILFFGTGKYSEKEDIASTQTQSFYCLIDNGIKYTGTPTSIIKGELDKLKFVTQGEVPECTADPTGGYKNPDIATRTVKKTIDIAKERGWYIDFNLKGCPPPGFPNNDIYRVTERLTEPPLIYGGIVFFTSFIPTTQPCSAGGIGYIHALTYRAGEAPKKETLVGTGEIGGYKVTSVYLGEGVPSRPVIDPVAHQLLVQMSDKGEILTIKIDIGINPVHILNWGEEGFVQYYR